MFFKLIVHGNEKKTSNQKGSDFKSSSQNNQQSKTSVKGRDDDDDDDPNKNEKKVPDDGCSNTNSMIIDSETCTDVSQLFFICLDFVILLFERSACSWCD